MKVKKESKKAFMNDEAKNNSSVTASSITMDEWYIDLKKAMSKVSGIIDNKVKNAFTVSDLINKTGWSRDKCYSIMRKLIDKKLVKPDGSVMRTTISGTQQRSPCYSFVTEKK